MKKVSLFAGMIALLVTFSSCEKCEPECNLVAAKIIRYDCDRVIFQLLTTEAIGDSVWEDVQTGQRYNNVVSYYNNCRIASFTNGEKKVIYIGVKKPAPDPNSPIPDCYRCQAISQDPPITQVDIVEISKSPCEQDANED